MQLVVPHLDVLRSSVQVLDARTSNELREQLESFHRLAVLVGADERRAEPDSPSRLETPETPQEPRQIPRLIADHGGAHTRVVRAQADEYQRGLETTNAPPLRQKLGGPGDDRAPGDGLRVEDRPRTLDQLAHPPLQQEGLRVPHEEDALLGAGR
jgi:plasmid stabilization system protein ParE